MRGGGALLLIADNAPAGSAAATLASRFNVDMSKGDTADPVNFERVAIDASWIQFSRANRNLGDHPSPAAATPLNASTRSSPSPANPSKAQKKSTPLLKLSPQAYDLDTLNNPAHANMVSATGRAQALPFNKGRLLVSGEAAMLTARTKTSA